VNRAEKSAVITDIQGRLQEASLAIITEYRGLTVAQINKLRRELKHVQVAYKIAKNTLAKRAVQATRFVKLADLMQGPTGLVITGKDPVTVAKVVVRFAEQHDKLRITGGVLDGQLLSAQEVKALASLPSRETLLAQLLGVLQAPAAQLLRTIQEPGARLVRLLGVLERRMAEAGGSPPEQG